MSSDDASSRQNYFVEDYWDIFLGVVFALIALSTHLSGNNVTATIFSALSIAAFSVTVSEIAEVLAERLEEPYGSFVLTFSAVVVEILLLFMILLQATTSDNAIDTVKGGIISAVIVDMNVLLGLAVFIGGLAYKKQEHNEDTSSSYTTILLVTASALLVPSILKNTGNEDTLIDASILIAGLLFVFYIVILIFQTKTHSHFFQATAKSRIFKLKRRQKSESEDGVLIDKHNYIFDRFSNFLNLIAIFLFILFIGFMAEIFAVDGMVVFKESGMSIGLAGLIIAIISVSPEIFTAVKAAKNDQIQRVVNIAMGASTVSILLTVPVLMALAYSVGITLTLDFNSLQIGALILTVILAWKTTDDGQTNYFEGMSHLMFFLSYAIIAALY